MFKSLHRILVLAVLASVAIPALLPAASPQFTAIHVNDMHCSKCAKKIAGKLYAVSGVVEVRASVKDNTAYVIPQQNKLLSPKSLWEAVEAAGFKPLKLAGPSGVFTSKPKT